MILLFTIGAASGRQGIRTLIPLGGTALAGRLGKPYPTTFRSSGPTGSRTRVSGLPSRCRSAGRWALRFMPVLSGPPGSRTLISALQERRLPVGRAAQFQSSRWELNPRSPPYQSGERSAAPRENESGRQDLNLRSRASEARGHSQAGPRPESRASSGN